MPEKPEKPTLLLIAHTYAIDEHAKKLPELARYFSLTCITVSKRSWGKHFGLAVEHARQSVEMPEYEIIELDARGDVNSVTGFVLTGLQDVISSSNWNIILVENEPWSLLKWQTFLYSKIYCRGAMYGEFTWENLIRPGLKGSILSIVYKLTARWADFWICGNRAAAKIVLEYGMPPESVLVSPQVGVDPNHYRPALTGKLASQKESFSIPSKSLVVGFAGRLVEEKGISDLLNAVEIINQSPAFKSHPVYLAFMGHGPMRSLIESTAAEKTWLKIFDPVPHHQLPAFLQCLDILVLGSHRVVNMQTCWEEQFGHVLIEAIACGALVLGSQSGAIPEVIGDNDLLFTPGSVNELADLLLKYLLDRDSYSIKKKQLQARLMEEYTHAAVADDWADFLLEKFHVSL